MGNISLVLHYGETVHPISAPNIDSVLSRPSAEPGVFQGKVLWTKFIGSMTSNCEPAMGLPVTSAFPHSNICHAIAPHNSIPITRSQVQYCQGYGKAITIIRVSNGKNYVH